MRLHRLPNIVAGMLLAVSVARSQDAGAVALLTNANQVLTGATPTTSVILTGSVNYVAGSTQDAGQIVMTASSLGSKVLMRLGSGDRLDIQQPGKGSWTGPDGVQHISALHNLQASASWFFPAVLVNEWLTDTKLQVSSIGAEERNGIAVQHIHCARTYLQQTDAVTSKIFSRAGAMDLFLDSATFLPVALEFNIHPDGNELQDLPIAIEFGNYQSVGNGQVPLHLQKYLQGTVLLDITVTNVNLNPVVSASDLSLQ